MFCHSLQVPSLKPLFSIVPIEISRTISNFYFVKQDIISTLPLRRKSYEPLRKRPVISLRIPAKRRKNSQGERKIISYRMEVSFRYVPVSFILRFRGVDSDSLYANNLLVT